MHGIKVVNSFLEVKAGAKLQAYDQALQNVMDHSVTSRVICHRHFYEVKDLHGVLGGPRSSIFMLCLSPGPVEQFQIKWDLPIQYGYIKKQPLRIIHSVIQYGPVIKFPLQILPSIHGQPYGIDQSDNFDATFW